MAAVVVDRLPSHLTEFALLERKLMLDTQVKGSAGGKGWDEIICSHELPDVMLFFSPTCQRYHLVQSLLASPY